jgi:hypothetical protein
VRAARSYHIFCHHRWLALGAELRARPPPADAAVAVLDDDVLLFESVADRLREAGKHHQTAQAETVVNGAFVIASAGALVRFAAFLLALYSLPVTAFAAVVWRFGTPRALHELNVRDRMRIHSAYKRGEQFARFSDMEAIDAFRLLSRAGKLPEQLRVRWASGHRRASCTHAPKVEKLGLSHASAVKALGHATNDNVPDTNASAATLAHAVHTGERAVPWRWAAGVPHVNGRPLCFLHLQGPQAKALLWTPLLTGAGLVDCCA